METNVMNQPKLHTFRFTWFKYDRYGKTLERKNKVTAQSLYAALRAFRNEFGNNRKVCITTAQELDEDGNVINNNIKADALNA